MSSTGQTLATCRYEERDIILCLIECVKITRFWHDFYSRFNTRGKYFRSVFDIYYLKSPEMENIREKLESYGIDFLREFPA